MPQLKARFVPAILDWEPYEDLEDPNLPSFAPFSMVGTCEYHGFQRVTFEGVTGGHDPSQYFKFQCGCVDFARFA